MLDKAGWEWLYSADIVEPCTIPIVTLPTEEEVPLEYMTKVDWDALWIGWHPFVVYPPQCHPVWHSDYNMDITRTDRDALTTEEEDASDMAILRRGGTDSEGALFAGWEVETGSNDYLGVYTLRYWHADHPDLGYSVELTIIDPCEVPAKVTMPDPVATLPEKWVMGSLPLTVTIPLPVTQPPKCPTFGTGMTYALTVPVALAEVFSVTPQGVVQLEGNTLGLYAGWEYEILIAALTPDGAEIPDAEVTWLFTLAPPPKNAGLQEIVSTLSAQASSVFATASRVGAVAGFRPGPVRPASPAPVISPGAPVPGTDVKTGPTGTDTGVDAGSANFDDTPATGGEGVTDSSTSPDTVTVESDGGAASFDDASDAANASDTELGDFGGADATFSVDGTDGTASFSI